MGDFNNVLKTQDRIGGQMVIEKEFLDLPNFMDTKGSSEMESNGDYYTWSNKHHVGTIYSKIDRVIANADWFQNHLNTTLKFLPPQVSDHALLLLTSQHHIRYKKRFRFINCVTKVAGFMDTIKANWNLPLEGRPMYVLWSKMKRLQPVMYKLNNSLTLSTQNIVQARKKLERIQIELINDRMNSNLIEEAKINTENLVYWQEVEVSILKQRAKLKWLKDGDGNSAFFHAAVKGKHTSKALTMLIKDDDGVLNSQTDIEREIMAFYGTLIGKSDDELQGIDVGAMRRGAQISKTQRCNMEKPISEA
ncbi:uncharacterized protein LOC131629929 [Vicia villosa]|uniref:uncharacterized protein LOC131629929 n=1 Tax=Vicia villosa TaxID=3911 RepID=UPI00273C89AD|nr:uncharacterized protein LOC131629929 [Vicia villosa]